MAAKSRDVESKRSPDVYIMMFVEILRHGSTYIPNIFRVSLSLVEKRQVRNSEVNVAGVWVNTDTYFSNLFILHFKICVSNNLLYEEYSVAHCVIFLSLQYKISCFPLLAISCACVFI